MKYKDIKDQYIGYSVSVSITMGSGNNDVISIALDELEVQCIDDSLGFIVLREP